MSNDLFKNVIFSSDEYQAQLNYWKQNLAGELKPIQLPYQHKSAGVRRGQRDSLSIQVATPVAQRILALCKKSDLNIYMVLLAALNSFLHKYTGEADLLVGSPLFNTTGDRYNTLVAMRNTINQQMTFKEVLMQTKKVAMEGYKHQDYPIDLVCKELGIDGQVADLVNLVFGYQQIHNEILADDSDHDLFFVWTREEDQLAGRVVYDAESLSRETVQQLVDYYLATLDYFVHHLDQQVGELEILFAAERERLLQGFPTRTSQPLPGETISEIFEAQVAKNPEQVAVVYDQDALTYGELNQRANQLARYLRQKQVAPNQVVAIMVERSLDMLVSIFGVLKAGVAYLPIDPDYPRERIDFMLKDSQAKLLITQETLLGQAESADQVVNLQDGAIWELDATNLAVQRTGQDLTYVIYTSGSTGQPKGVMIENHSLINLVAGLKEQIYDRYQDKLHIAMLSPYVFDASVKQIFPALLLGHTLFVVPEEVRLQQGKLLQYFTRHQLHVIDGTPTLLKTLLGQEEAEFEQLAVKQLVVGGEELAVEFAEQLLEKFPEPKPVLTNVYGPTECCDVTTACTVEYSQLRELAQIPIGSPLTNVRTYIVNHNQELAMPGLPGELCVAGEGVARGYLNQPELTEQKFIPDPFMPGSRMYQTGDLVRQLPDGQLEFMGRIDQQVKVRGYRIELGEIENRLVGHDALQAAVVTVHQDEQGNKDLCAYIVLARHAQEEEVTVVGLRDYLAQQLPNYMVPSFFVQLDELPLTPNGKVDRKALPAPNGGMTTGAEYEAPRNELEEQLVEIWTEILGVNKIGINDSFFDLGGHSLKATRLIAKLHKELQVEIPLREIFAYPTIKELATYLQGTDAQTSYAEIPVVAEKEFYPVSSAQKRIFAIDQFEPSSTSYNMPGILEITGALDVARLEGAFQSLIERQASLRTSFHLVNEVPVQKVHSEVEFAIEVQDLAAELSGLSQEELADEVEQVAKKFIRPFELSQAPLLRVGLVKIDAEKHILMYDLHHIIADGVSMGVLVREVAQLYTGQQLPELRIQYQDFADWQNQLLASDEMQAQEAYWTETFAGEIPVLNLPTDYPRPAEKSFEGDRIRFTLDRKLTAQLKETAQETGSTLHMVLLTALNILLAKYSGQDEIVVGSPVAGRPQADLEKIIGMFVNTLALRNAPKAQKTIGEFLSEVKENALQAYENQDYQFEELVDRLQIPRDLSRNPLFDVMLVMQNMERSELQVDDLTFTAYVQDDLAQVAKFDLAVIASELDDEIILHLDYWTRLFKRETVQRMGAHLTNILTVLSANLHLPLGEIDLLTEEERMKLLGNFNDTQTDAPINQTVQQVFEAQVARTPEATALEGAGASLTYRELNTKANQLARVLRERGVTQGTIVGVIADRSPAMVTGILAILKAGGVYLPINPSYPAERIKYMLADSQAALILTEEALVGQIPFDGPILTLTDPAILKKENTNLELVQYTQSLAYIIYTSGSTGQPKGVMIPHRALTNYLFGLYERYDQQVGAGDRCLSMANISFDASVVEFFLPLAFGATLVLFDHDLLLDLDQLGRTVIDHGLTFMLIPASLLQQVYQVLAGEQAQVQLDKLLVGLEPIKDSVLADYLELNPKMQILNGYGPTETTICSTFYKYEVATRLDKNIPIGKPTSNTRIYLVDAQNHLVPLGAVGEVCIAGAGLANGYLNRPDLTAEKFVSNPFEPGQPMYKTGDLARWLPDGNLDFLGRMDHQVKVRGYRIELGEIEHQLIQHSAVRDAVVLVKNSDANGQQDLCAYLLVDREKENQPTVAELRENLATELPEYMIPGFFVPMEQFPLTANGKIDRKALPAPDGLNLTGGEYVAPEGELERKLVEIWQAALGVDKIGVTDNFFELGGHSLKATSLIAKIEKELQFQVSLKQIFKSPTIRGLANTLTKETKGSYAEIEPIAKQDYYQLSPAQRRIYAIQQFDKTSTSYNMPGVLQVIGELDQARLAMAFEELIRRHEILRTGFAMVGDQPVQQVVEKVEFAIELTQLDPQASEVEISREIQNFVRAFDLTQPPLLRVGLFQLTDREHILIYDLHHIVADGISMGVLVQEFINLYHDQDLPKLRVQYKDYAAWQNQLLSSGGMKKQEEFWLETFAGEVPVLNLPTDRPRPAVKSFAGQRFQYQLGRELTARLNATAQETGSTLYMVLLAAYNILLAKYSGQDDLVVGTPHAGRPHADLEKMIGMFVNTLALRNQPQGEKTIGQFLDEVRENALQAFAHQDYQFEELVEKLDLPRNLSRNPLFDVMFVMQNMDLGELEVADLAIAPYPFENKISKFDLTVTAYPTTTSDQVEELALIFEYSARLFESATIERMSSHLIKILETMAEDLNREIAAIELLPESERQKLLAVYNQTGVDYPREQTIYQLFARQAAQTPEAVAICCGADQLTYGELADQASRLAHRLRQVGVKPNQVVGVLTEPSLEMAIGILGVLHAGGAYLPMDPTNPVGRIEYMLADLEVEVLLTQTQVLEKIQTNRNKDGSLTPTEEQPFNFHGEIILLELEELTGIVTTDTDTNTNMDTNTDPIAGSTANSDLTLGEVAEDKAVINQPTDLAYVIYTSGSTGQPKGVQIEHQSITNTIYWRQNEYQLGSQDVSLQLFSYSFDGFLTSFFTPLVAGAKVVLLPKNQAKDPLAIKKAITTNGVTHLLCVPALYTTIVETLTPEEAATLQVVTLAGEQVTTPLIEKSKALKNNLRMVNEYGPTENSVVTTIERDLQPDQRVTIGQPIANTRIYIVDHQLHLVPEGVPGELCVSGVGLARGYANQPELTAEKFIANPFEPGTRMYRTGDLARWLPDGRIEFIGRIDHQVKIRGFRIELGEIEKQLLQLPLIQQVSVLARQDATGTDYLVAYIVAETEIAHSELKTQLAQQLPDYMIPTYFVQLETMPLSANGKVNRRALPEPESDQQSAGEYVEPTNEVEAKLAEIWSSLLGIEQIGIIDNFFQLGGHSLKAASMIAKIHQEFQVEIPLTTLFAHPTIAELARSVVEADQRAYTAIPPAPVHKYYPVSAAQKRLYILSQFGGVGISYNMPGAMILEGAVDRERLEAALAQLIERHETLRTSFTTQDGEVVQQVHPDAKLQVTYTETAEADLAATMNSFVQPFNLEMAPLFRVGLFKLAPEKYLLSFDLHHIISDGVSMNILMQEFVALYHGQALPELKVHYKDFSVWQQQRLAEGIIQQQEQYWLDTFTDPEQSEIPVLNLPTDYPRPAVKSYEGSSVTVQLDPELTQKLNHFATEQGVTLYMTLLASYNLLLAKYTRQEDIVVGSPIAGRDHIDLEGMIGIFINTLALRNYPVATKTFTQFLQEVKGNTLKAFENQEYQFEDLVEKLELPRDLSRNPLFDTMLVLQNMDAQPLAMNGLVCTPYEVPTQVAKFDLTLTVEESDDSLGLSMAYSTKLFKSSTIEGLLRHYIRVLEQVVVDADRTLAQIDLLLPTEKEQILGEFNQTQADYPHDRTLQQIFEEQVAATPDQVAIVWANQELTYQELNVRANQLATTLRTAGVQPNQLVPIIAERSIEMMVGILGIIKAGAGYLPISPEYPVDRISYLLEDSGAEVLLTTTNGVSKVEFSGRVLNLQDESLYVGEGGNLPLVNQPTDLAYVIYTSGSTGKPKGVMIEHTSAINRIHWMQKKYPIGATDTILQKTPFTFDVSVWEIFWWSFAGARQALLAPGGEKDPAQLVAAIEKYQVTTMHFVPSMLSAFLQYVEGTGCQEQLASLRQVFASGEALTLSQVQTFNRLLYEINGTTLHNLYGPTEATVDVSYFDCSPGAELELIPIGQPIDNIQLYVVDANYQLCPVGVPGELCIAGVGLARGYLERPELTAEKFVANPFSPGERMYRTGDLARWLANGQIEFMGRLDHQVKIRGFRIELGEIENQLISHAQVKEAVVLAKVDASGHNELCAYLVADQAKLAAGAELTVLELREHLAQELPEYMIPAHFVQLEEIPLTGNGKINRKALLAIDQKLSTGVEYEAPQTDLEKQIAEIWEELLGVTQIGRYDHFFQVGGNSLKIIQLNQRLATEMQIQLSVTDLFKYTNIFKLAQHIEAMQRMAGGQVAATTENANNHQQLDEGRKRLQQRMQRRKERR